MISLLTHTHPRFATFTAISVLKLKTLHIPSKKHQITHRRAQPSWFDQ